MKKQAFGRLWISIIKMSYKYYMHEEALLPKAEQHSKSFCARQNCYGPSNINSSTQEGFK